MYDVGKGDRKIVQFFTISIHNCTHSMLHGALDGLYLAKILHVVHMTCQLIEPWHNINSIEPAVFSLCCSSISLLPAISVIPFFSLRLLWSRYHFPFECVLHDSNIFCFPPPLFVTLCLTQRQTQILSAYMREQV